MIPSWLKVIATAAIGFFKEHTPQSSARLTGIALTFSACAIALGSLAFAFKNPSASATIAALAGMVTALGGFGYKAIDSRSRTGESS